MPIAARLSRPPNAQKVIWPSDCRIDGRYQMIAQQRFVNVSDRPVRKTLLPDRRLVVGGNENDRQAHLRERQLPLDVASGEPRHVEIQYDAIRAARVQRIEKFLPGREGENFAIAAMQHPRKGATDRLIIIHNGNKGSYVHYQCSGLWRAFASGTIVSQAISPLRLVISQPTDSNAPLLTHMKTYFNAAA